MEKGFKFIDTISELDKFLQERKKNKHEMAVACDELIKSHQEMIALIRSFAEEVSR